MIMLVADRVRTAATGACALALALGWACAASAQNGHSLREALLGAPGEDGRKHADAPPVARYVSESGSRFVVDRSGRNVLFKFDHSPEIWVLRPAPAPGGDVVYRNDVGDPVLKASRYGGMTLFSQERPMGAPAALAGPAGEFRPAPMSPQSLQQRLLQASVKATQAAGHLIAFDAPDVSAASAFLVADTAAVAVGAIARLKRIRGGDRVLPKIKVVRILEGARPGASMRSNALEITVAPEQGLAGRPSSGRMIQAAMLQ